MQFDHNEKDDACTFKRSAKLTFAKRKKLREEMNVFVLRPYGVYLGIFFQWFLLVFRKNSGTMYMLLFVMVNCSKTVAITLRVWQSTEPNSLHFVSPML